MAGIENNPSITPPNSPAPSPVTKAPTTKSSSLTVRAGQAWSLVKSAVSGLTGPREAAPTSRAARLKKLDGTADSRLKTNTIVERLLLKYPDTAKLREAIDHIFEKDPRFNGTKPDQFSVAEGLKEDLLAQINAGLPAHTETAVGSISKPLLQTPTQANVEAADEKPSSGGLTKEEQAIAASLAGLVERRPAISIAGGSTIVQFQGHVENGEWKQGYAISAEVQKTESKVREIANHGYVAMGGDSTRPGKVVVSRSARTDTKEKIADKSIADISARLRDPAKTGLTEVKSADGRVIGYSYQRVDVTLMDTSGLKALATSAKTGMKSLVNRAKGKGAKPVENERAFVASKKKAVRDLWKNAETEADTGKKYITRELKDPTTGMPVLVREYEPVVLNYVFSGQAEKSGLDKVFGGNVANARKDNIDGQLTLLSRVTGFMPVLAKAIVACRDNPTEENKAELVRLIDTSATNPGYSSSQQLALLGVRIALTGEDKNGNKYDTAEGSAQQYLFASILSDLAGCGFSVECKSGNDRTATATALKCAQEEWRQTHGGDDFDPRSVQDDPHALKQFSESFRKYIIDFGTPNIVASRGTNKVIKTRGSPVFLLFNRQLKPVDSTKDDYNVNEHMDIVY